MPDVDAAIIGAGVAGLAAAGDLARAGLRVVCLEARDRIGGRVFTARDPLCPLPIELGAEFVHGCSPELFQIIRAQHLAAYDCAGCMINADEGQFSKEDETEEELERLMHELRNRERDQTLASFLDESSFSEDAKRSAAGFIEGFNAARKEVIGIASVAEDMRASEATGGLRSFRIFDGYDSIARAVAEGVEVRLNSRVVEVAWKRGSVSVRTQSETWRARSAVITIPLSLLQGGSIRFDPEPKESIAAARELAVGQVYRIALRFERAFWEDQPQLAEAGFIFSGRSPFPTWWTALPFRVPLIIGWSAGPHADALRNKCQSTIIAEALTSLADITGLTPPRPEAIYFHDWQRDPFACGAYSYVPAGALPARRKLAEPVAGTLYFAGEAINLEGHSATVHGAIASGRSAAKLILAGR